VSAAAQGADMTLFSQHVSGFIAMLHIGRCDPCRKCLLASRSPASLYVHMTISRQGMHGSTGEASLQQVTSDESQELNNIWQIY